MTSRLPPQRSPLPRETLGLARRERGVFAKAVGSLLPRLTAKAFEKYGFSAASLVTDWPAIAGAELAAYTAPERLNWPRATADDEAGSGRAGATLVLRVDGARALDVQYGARQIIERINSFFGYAAVARLRIVQGPVAGAQPRARQAPRARAEPLMNEVAHIADPGLRNALARLGAEIKAGR